MKRLPTPGLDTFLRAQNQTTISVGIVWWGISSPCQDQEPAGNARTVLKLHICGNAATRFTFILTIVGVREQEVQTRQTVLWLLETRTGTMILRR